MQKITFRNNRRFEDVSRRIPNLSINVVENHINYIGDIRFDYTFENDSNTCAIPYKVVERPSDAMVGFAFGAVGALITEAKRSMAPDEYHTLTIEAPPELKTNTGSSLPVVNSPLSFKHRPKGQNGPEFETIKVNKSR